ncbi:MAG: toll/interleukin-1 receptor domain-containing protein [Planctomycetota bacterium]
MANPKHVKIVKQGKAAIEAWLRKDPATALNLAGADLRGADLRGVNLCGIDFDGTIMFGADLNGAALGGADLSGAILEMSDLRQADLSRADLRRAVLFGVDLGGATLNEALIENAEIGNTILANVDLSKVKGLGSVKHWCPSSIGVDTLYRSQGKIPEEFLRGCGVPEDFITYLPSLVGTMQPIQYQSCFISYSSRDDEFARRLHERMRAEKLRVWFAPEEMQGGKKIIEQIDRAIQVNDRLLLVLSEDSMNSEWVRREIKRARASERVEKRTKLFPIGLVPITPTIRNWRCDDADTGEDLAEKIREYHIPDFSNWKNHDAFEAAFADLLRDLRAQA